MREKILFIYLLIIIGALLMLTNSCKKDNKGQVPVLSTSFVGDISYATATCGGSIISEGTATITIRGICWSKSTAPTLNDIKTINGAGAGNFTSTIIGLSPRTTYYVRAYATNSVGTGYGNTISFITQNEQVPILATTDVSDIMPTTVTCGGNISSDGGTVISARGVCWSTYQNPTTANNKTTNGIGTGIFASSITGLTPGASYYIRAYATNSIGTAYGNQINTTTTAILPLITTTSVSDITVTTANSGGIVTSDGGSAVIARGVCWSTTTGPTTALNTKTTDGTGTGTFTSSITGLPIGTLYYVRAYATNSVGTSYGTQVSFTTTSFTCGGTLTIIHTLGDGISPVTKTVNYGTITTGLSGAGKCWITQNLGSSNQASSATDATDVSAGWYWQFNRKQGYANNATVTTPAWTITSIINENSDWLPANDPCTLKLGIGWRIPTYTEWLNANMTGGWVTGYAAAAYASVLKLHAAGFLFPGSGVLYFRGNNGYYWSSTENFIPYGWNLNFDSSTSSVSGYDKAGGFSVRCLRD